MVIDPLVASVKIYVDVIADEQSGRDDRVDEGSFEDVVYATDRNVRWQNQRQNLASKAPKHKGDSTSNIRGS